MIRIRKSTYQHISDKYDDVSTETVHFLIEKGLVAEALFDKSKNYILFLMNFFQRNAAILKPAIRKEDIPVFKEISEFLKDFTREGC